MVVAVVDAVVVFVAVVVAVVGAVVVAVVVVGAVVVAVVGGRRAYVVGGDVGCSDSELARAVVKTGNTVRTKTVHA